MEYKKMVATIQTHDVFAELSPEEIKPLEKIVASMVYKKDELVFSVDSTPNFLYFVEEGSFILYFPNNEHLHLSKGELIGELGLLNGDFRLGSLRAQEDSKVITVCGTKLFHEGFIPPETALKIVRQLGKRVTNYFRSAQQTSSNEMIKQGESDEVEFKSTMRWNLHTNKKDKAIEFAILKTISAFMNSEGGHLFIGVSDKGEALGLEADHFENDDKMLLHLTHLVKNKIGPLFLQYIHTSIEELDGKKILRIDCLPASSPAYILDDKEDFFYIRTGPASTKVKASKIYSYIKDHFELSK